MTKLERQILSECGSCIIQRPTRYIDRLNRHFDACASAIYFANVLDIIDKLGTMDTLTKKILDKTHRTALKDNPNEETRFVNAYELGMVKSILEYVVEHVLTDEQRKTVEMSLL